MAILYKDFIGGLDLDALKIKEEFLLPFLANGSGDLMLKINSTGKVGAQTVPSGGGTPAIPTNQVVFGTGSGISSSNMLLYDGQYFDVGSATPAIVIRLGSSDSQGRITYGNHKLSLAVDNDHYVASFTQSATGIGIDTGTTTIGGVSLKLNMLAGGGIRYLVTDNLGNITGTAAISNYTSENARDDIAAFIQNGVGISWVHNDAGDTLTPAITLAPFNTGNLTEGVNLYWTQARFDSAFSLKSTTLLPEGTNLYYTDVRADARITLQKGAANGLATLDSGGKIPSSQLPLIALTNTTVVASQAAMLALVAQTGDVAIRTDLNKSFILAGNDPTVLANWQEILAPTGGGGGITSVNGFTGPSVTLTTSNIAEGSNLYYTNTRVQTYGDTRYVVSAGLSGGQTVNGGVNASENLILKSTAHTTKGKILLGNANNVWDEVNERLGIGTGSPSNKIHIEVSSGLDQGVFIRNQGTGSNDTAAVKLQNQEGYATLFLANSTGLNALGFYFQQPKMYFLNSGASSVFEVYQDGHVILPQSAGTLTINNLSGTGNRMVIASSTGLLSTQAIPASGMSNPMTTLGDIIYENSTPAPARLPGNTGTTKRFLSQTGTGSASAAPVWDTIVAGDVGGISGANGIGYATGTITLGGTITNDRTLDINGGGVTQASITFNKTNPTDILRFLGFGITTAPAHVMALNASQHLVTRTLSEFSYDMGSVRVLHTNTTVSGNIGTTATDLTTYTIPAGLLANNGDSLEFEYGWKLAVNGNSKNFSIVFGSETILGITTTAIGDYYVRGTITRLSETTQIVVWSGSSAGTAIVNKSQTLSSALVLKTNGTGGATDDVIHYFTKLKFVRA